MVAQSTSVNLTRMLSWSLLLKIPPTRPDAPLASPPGGAGGIAFWDMLLQHFRRCLHQLSGTGSQRRSSSSSPRPHGNSGTAFRHTLSPLSSKQTALPPAAEQNARVSKTRCSYGAGTTHPPFIQRLPYSAAFDFVNPINFQFLPESCELWAVGCGLWERWVRLEKRR